MSRGLWRPLVFGDDCQFRLDLVGQPSLTLSVLTQPYFCSYNLDVFLSGPVKRDLTFAEFCNCLSVSALARPQEKVSLLFFINYKKDAL